MALSAETNQRVAFNNCGVWLQQAVNGVEEAQRKGALIVSVISAAENEKRQCACRSPENSYLQKKSTPKRTTRPGKRAPLDSICDARPAT
jgi:BRCT domain type II-containing protein